MSGAQVELDGVLGDPVRILGLGRLVLGHRDLTRSVDRDRAREDEALAIAQHRLVDEVDRGLEVRAVVVGADEVRQPLGRIGAQVVDVVKPAVAPQRRDEVGVAQVALDPAGSVGHVLHEPAAEVVGRDDIHPQLHARIGDVRPDEPRRAGHQRALAGHLGHD